MGGGFINKFFINQTCQSTSKALQLSRISWNSLTNKLEMEVWGTLTCTENFHLKAQIEFSGERKGAERAELIIKIQFLRI